MDSSANGSRASFRSGQVTSTAYRYPINPADISVAAFSHRTRSFVVDKDDADKARRLAEVPAPRFVRLGTAKIVSLSRRCEAKQRNDRARDVVRNGGRVVSGSLRVSPRERS